jgi:hypothetical protein
VGIYFINGGKEEMKQKLLIVLITSILTAVLTISTTLYVSHYLQPSLKAKYAWYKLEYHENKSGKFAGDIEFFRTDISSGELINQLEWRIKDDGPFTIVKNKISSMWLVTSEVVELLKQECSPKKVLVPKKGYTGKILLENIGQSMATNIQIGIAFPFKGDLSIFATPNVEIKNKAEESYSYKKSAPYEFPYEFPLEVIIINQLPRKSKAIITVNWSFSENDIPMIISSQYPANWQSLGFLPQLLFLSSDQGVVTIGSLIPFHVIAEEEIKITGVLIPGLQEINSLFTCE